MGPDVTVADAAELNEDQKMLVKAARAGQLIVVRLFSGDPLLFSAAATEAAVLAKAKVPFEVVPGVPNATAVAAYAASRSPPTRWWGHLVDYVLLMRRRCSTPPRPAC